MRLSLGTVNLLGMHIIPLLTINAGTQFTYPLRNGAQSTPSHIESGVGIEPGTSHGKVQCSTN